MPANPIELDEGDSITDFVNGANLDLTHAGLPNKSGHKVDAGQSLNYSAAPSVLTVGTAITALEATARGFTTGTVSYEVTTGTLPAGLTLDATTGAITGAPTTADTETTSVTVTATAGSGANAPTATASITFPAVGKRALAEPGNLRLSGASLGSTGFTVYWNVVPNASGYRVTATASGSPAVTVKASYTETGLQAWFTELDAGTTYRVSMTATGDANYADTRRRRWTSPRKGRASGTRRLRQR